MDGFALPERLGRYRIGAVLGVGGFAIVVRAHDQALAADVAIKVLSAHHAFDPELRERFVQEARLLRRVHDPAVVAVHDVGETPDGRPYFVMDLAERGTLAARIEAASAAGEVAPDRADVAAVIDAVADGLEALHASGVIHRDVKPSNLLLMQRRGSRVPALPGDVASASVSGRIVGDDERLVLGDLGLALDQTRSVAGPTMIGGTPLFQAPEQLELGALIDARTDVYGASALLWNVLTGRRPPVPTEVALRLHELGEPWRLAMAQGLAAAPYDRYPSIAAWRAAMVDANGGAVSLVAGGSSRARVVAAPCPYKGLAAYESEDASLFFGRDELVDQLVARMQGRATLVIGGPSGSGKSSVLRAGLLTALRDGALPGSEAWPICLMSPARRPLAELHAQLAIVAERDGGAALPSVERLAAEPELVRRSVSGTPVIAIDQFEEVFAHEVDRAERDAFVAVLAALTAGVRPTARVVLAVRADFYGRCASVPWLGGAINDNQVLVGPMPRAQLRQVIEGPARRAGLRLEDGLADRIMDEAGDDAGALPLVAHALVETWVRRQGSVLTMAGYEAAGGVVGAIGLTAEQVWDRLDEPRRAAAKRLLLQLVHVGEGSDDTRRLASWSELADDAETTEVRTTFAEARLLTVDERGVELAHEALIRAWGRLGTWVDESRDELRARERIAQAAADWDRLGRSEDLLYRGTQLDSALEWRAQAPVVAPVADAFLTASSEAKQEEQHRVAAAAARSRALRRRAIGALAAFAAVALLTSVVAVLALTRARRDASAAKTSSQRAALDLTRSLAATAQLQTAADPYAATVLAAEAVARMQPPLVEARAALVAAREALTGDALVPVGDPIPVGGALTVDVDPAGTRAVTGDRDGLVTVWDLATHRPLGRLVGPGKGIEKVQFGPDGTWVVAGTDAGVWQWSVPRQPWSEPVNGHSLGALEGIVWGVAVSPDGATVAAATQHGELWLLDATTGARRGAAVATRVGEFTSVAFSPDGAVLLAGTGTGEVDGWSLPLREPAFTPVAAHTSDVWELVVDRQLGTFLTVSSDGTIKAWDLATGAPQAGGPYDAPSASDGASSAGPAEPPVGAAGATLGPDGRTVRFGNADGRVYTWSLETHALVAVTAAAVHSDRITDAARSADGRTVVTLADDQTVRVLTGAEREPPWTPIATGEGPWYSVAAGDAALAVGTGAGTVLVFDRAGGPARQTLRGWQGRVFAAAFTATGRLLAGDQRGTLRWVDPADGKELGTVADAHPGGVNAVAVAPDGASAATVGADGTLRQWTLDASGIQPRGEPQALGAPATAVAFAPDGKSVVAATAAGMLSRWSVDAKRLGSPARVSPGTVWSLAVSPNGATVAAATAEETVGLWSFDGAAWKHLRDVGPLGGGASAVAFVDDATMVASSRSGVIRFWDAGTGQSLGGPLVNGTTPIWHLATAANVVWAVQEAGALLRVDALDAAAACRAAGATPAVLLETARQLGSQEAMACRAG